MPQGAKAKKRLQKQRNACNLQELVFAPKAVILHSPEDAGMYILILYIHIHVYTYIYIQILYSIYIECTVYSR